MVARLSHGPSTNSTMYAFFGFDSISIKTGRRRTLVFSPFLLSNSVLNWRRSRLRIPILHLFHFLHKTRTYCVRLEWISLLFFCLYFIIIECFCCVFRALIKQHWITVAERGARANTNNAVNATSAFFRFIETEPVPCQCAQQWILNLCIWNTRAKEKHLTCMAHRASTIY